MRSASGSPRRFGRSTGRGLPIMIIIESGDNARLLGGLDMGVNDYIVRPVEETVEMAILDPLTALHNRRYMTSHLKTLLEESS